MVTWPDFKRDPQKCYRDEIENDNVNLSDNTCILYVLLIASTIAKTNRWVMYGPWGRGQYTMYLERYF